MSASLEGNKILAAALTAGIIAMSSGFLARVIYNNEPLAEAAYPIEVEVATASVAGGAEEEVSVLAMLAAADPAKGQKVAKKCAGCHTFDDGGANKVGPNLYGVLGRQIGSAAGFSYSDALGGMSGQSWDFESLAGFLASPKKYAPGTKMSFGGIKKPKQLADLISYMRGQSGSPLPLPE